MASSEDMFSNSEEINKDELEDKINDVSSKVNIDSDTEMDQGGEESKEIGSVEDGESENKDESDVVNPFLATSDVVNDEEDDPVDESEMAEEPNEDSEVVDDPDQDEAEDTENVLGDKTNVPSDSKSTPSKDTAPKLFRFPHNKIKQIMKLDPDVGMVNAEAIFLVNKAVEEFIQCLAVESYHHTTSSKKKTIMKEHVKTAIETTDELAFLDGAMED
eukprot:TRINITY_DN54176_c0_g1_i1.p1 TRINITY_DN54176_c0_g1~~TRINITY_DN54176_c0_g1_i1.p1  ORF type:complete len:217 (-),score=97.50 TRINITY_DN54176_c0_g1_i1:115-765(-)